MDITNAFKSNQLQDLDSDGGVLTLTAYWRPRPEDPLPQCPGEKVFTLIYLPVQSTELCPCGSGKRFDACCQPLPYWRPICPNPGLNGSSLLCSQSATFADLDDDAVYAFLQDDERLSCIEDTSDEAMWLYWGDPVLESPSGIHCFGDFQLQRDQTLMITALSDTRMEVLLEVLSPLELGIPQVHKESLPRLPKPLLLSAALVCFPT